MSLDSNLSATSDRQWNLWRLAEGGIRRITGSPVGSQSVSDCLQPVGFKRDAIGVLGRNAEFVESIAFVGVPEAAVEQRGKSSKAVATGSRVWKSSGVFAAAPLCR